MAKVTLTRDVFVSYATLLMLFPQWVGDCWSATERSGWMDGVTSLPFFCAYNSACLFPSPFVSAKWGCATVALHTLENDACGWTAVYCNASISVTLRRIGYTGYLAVFVGRCGQQSATLNKT